MIFSFQEAVFPDEREVCERVVISLEDGI